MQLDLGPDADREHRYLDLVELLEGRALLPERVVERMLVGFVGKIPRQHLRRAGGGILVQRPQLAVIPGAGELAGDATGVRDAGIGIDQPVIRRDTGEVWRVLRRHEPLRHRVIGCPMPPILPSDHGCCATHSITSKKSVCSLLSRNRYSPPERPVPRTSIWTKA